MVRMVQLTTTSGVLHWRWNADGKYTSKNCYDTLSGSGQFELLEVELEVLGSPQELVFRVARLPGWLSV